ncbi:MAG: hypothetical protein HW376_968 [candidate division NC10 bacterium]|nr:hypothetical protein [candidate division NC10 bacterium]MBM2842167.1 hypothetical protein [Anaerolineales bacterium]
MGSRTARRAAIGMWYGGLVLGGTLLVQAATPWGIGIRHDSLAYLTAAQSLSNGTCLCWMGSGQVLKPLIHFGPLYPTLLWAVTVLSGDVLVSARWVAAVLFGVNLAVWGALVHLHTRRFWAGAIVSGMLAASLVVLQLHDAAMSEPLFLAILALAMMALADFLASGRSRSLWLAAGAVSLSVLTRYAAGSLVGLGVVAILLLRPTSWKGRLADALRFGAGAALPVVLWSARNIIVAGTATNRVLRWHPTTVDDLRTFLRLVTAWFNGGTYSHWLEGATLVGVLVLLAVFLWGLRRTDTGETDAAPVLGLLLVGLAGLYPVYIGVARSLFDDSIPIDDRMFAPIFVALAALTGVVAALVARHRRARWILLPALSLLLIASLPYMVSRFRIKYESMRRDGVLFGSHAWRDSRSVAWARSLPEDSVVYSNQALVLQFLTGRPVSQLPDGFDSVKGEERTDFDDQLARMRIDLRKPNSYLLIFNPASPASPEELQDEFKAGLSVVQVTEDGFVMASDASEIGP